uniref:Uncharacterized protein n=1 Tax=Cucumis melo TaxID=3656 RepID=A0A9I9EHP1_CUCME
MIYSFPYQFSVLFHVQYGDALQKIGIFSRHKTTSEEITSGQTPFLDANFHTSDKCEHIILLLPFSDTVKGLSRNKNSFPMSGCRASGIISN